MMAEESPSVWLRQLRTGNDQAAQQLWEAYYRRLVALARRKLEGRQRLVDDAEDVALSAFMSFCKGVRDGRFPQLNDRYDLWRLLMTITLHKVLHLVRDEGRQKRGGKDKTGGGHGGSPDPIEEIVAQELTPELAAEIAEQCAVLLSDLPTADLVELAILKMEGHTNSEIAARWGRTERTVERKLQMIRQIWSKRLSAE
jgi:RNA polymerase sigma factor (sigma-70 family)